MKAIDVANFFIEVGKMNEGSEMTNARINKLLYFAQGWYLVKTGKPLFDEKIEAWEYGPVVSSIYQAFKVCGRNIITDTLGDFDIENIDDDMVEFLTDVFTNYSNYSTSALINLTHKDGSPWDKVYIQDKNKIIPIKLIKDYFSSLPKLKTAQDDINALPEIGYINDEGFTVLPSEYGRD